MPRSKEARIIVGNQAGWHFVEPSGIHVIYHCREGLAFGFYHIVKRLANRAAFDYDPTMGWEYDRWFEWPRGRENDSSTTEPETKP